MSEIVERARHRFGRSTTNFGKKMAVGGAFTARPEAIATGSAIYLVGERLEGAKKSSPKTFKKAA